jgi:hypothetical protein
MAFQICSGRRKSAAFGKRRGSRKARRSALHGFTDFIAREIRAGADSVVWSLRFREGTREVAGAPRLNPRRNVPSADRRR